VLKQKYLKFKGIGRFVEEQTITFETLSKFVQLGGQNNNTKGSSGAGKSTVFMAEDYLFGISNRPGTVLKSRLSDDGIWVEGLFDYDGKVLLITRGKKLCITIDGVPTIGNSEKTEEELDRIIGMPRKLFGRLLHKRQKEGGFFLDMVPSDMNNFLMSALDLNSYKKKIQIADDKIAELIEKKESNVTKLTAARSALKATEDATLSLGLPPVKDIDQSLVLELKGKADKSANALAAAVSHAKVEEAHVTSSRPHITSSSFDRSVIEKLEKKHSEAQAVIRTAQVQERDRQNQAKLKMNEYKNQLAKLDNLVRDGNAALQAATVAAEQIKKIRLGKCYTCGHDWVDSKEETKIINSIKTFREMIAAGNQAAPQITPLAILINQTLDETVPREVDTREVQRELDSYEFQLVQERQKESEHRQTENKKNKELLSAFETRESEMRARHRETLDQARGQSDIDRRAFEAALGRLKAYEAARARHDTSLTSLKAQEASYGTKILDLMAEAKLVVKELEMAEELKRGLKSYLSCSFDEALETISENATKLIRHIPNMANATIQLTGVKETQDGKIKEEVTAIIHMDGEENVPIKSLCGGERTATDLAIDLSVIDMLESKANKGIDLFILDEPFDGLDTVCIEMALEVLKNSNSNKRLIIVDHNPEVKEMVESRLVVVRDGPVSHIVQAA
jgi:DNA repair exonuclease SbcCD ATPase subunit